MELGYLAAYSKDAVRQAAELGFEWLELTNWFSEDGADIAALEEKKEEARCGVHGTGWWRFTIPGEGDVDWKGLFDTFRTAGYDGTVVIEHEDANYSGGRFTEGLIKARDFLRSYL